LQKHARQSPREKIPFICPHNSVNKKMSSDRFRKRNYASPQKMQTSIISYSNLQKKVNHNPTPDRPLMRTPDDMVAVLGALMEEIIYLDKLHELAKMMAN